MIQSDVESPYKAIQIELDNMTDVFCGSSCDGQIQKRFVILRPGDYVECSRNGSHSYGEELSCITGHPNSDFGSVVLVALHS